MLRTDRSAIYELTCKLFELKKKELESKYRQNERLAIEYGKQKLGREKL